MAKQKRVIEIEGVGSLHNLGDIISEIVQDIQEAERQKLPIGIVAPETCKKYLAWREKQDRFEKEVERTKEKLERQVQRQLAEMFEDRFHDLQHDKEKLWDEIREEVNCTDTEASLNIDTEAGIISKWVE